MLREPETDPQRIVREAMEGEADEAALDPFEALLAPRNKRRNLQIPVVDPVVCRRVLLFLADEVPMLIKELDALKDRRSKTSHAAAKLLAWNKAFNRMSNFKGWRRGQRKDYSDL